MAIGAPIFWFFGLIAIVYGCLFLAGVFHFFADNYYTTTCSLSISVGASFSILFGFQTMRYKNAVNYIQNELDLGRFPHQDYGDYGDDEDEEDYGDDKDDGDYGDDNNVYDQSHRGSEGWDRGEYWPYNDGTEDEWEDQAADYSEETAGVNEEYADKDVW